MTQKTNPWTMDVRVRERNLKSGALTDKDVEKYLGGLPDLVDQAEPFGTAQPALAQPVVAPAPIESASDVEADDEEVGDEVVAEDIVPAAAEGDGASPDMGNANGEGVS